MINKPNRIVVLLIALAVMALIVWLGVRYSPDSIHNPDNQPFVLEVAFNECVDVDGVTQLQFNERYLK